MLVLYLVDLDPCCSLASLGWLFLWIYQVRADTLLVGIVCLPSSFAFDWAYGVSPRALLVGRFTALGIAIPPIMITWSLPLALFSWLLVLYDC